MHFSKTTKTPVFSGFAKFTKSGVFGVSKSGGFDKKWYVLRATVSERSLVN